MADERKLTDDGDPDARHGRDADGSRRRRRPTPTDDDGDTDGTDGGDTDGTDADADAEDPSYGDALARCVEPIDAAEFLAEYWEQQPLAVPRSEAGRFDDLLSVADVERLVSSGGLRYPAFRLVKEGGQIAAVRVRDRPLLAAEALHRHGRPGPGRDRVRGRRDDRPPGAAPQLAAARAVLPRAGGRARTARCRRTRTTRRAARRASRSTTTRTTSSCSRSRARSTGGSTTRCSSCR